MSNTVLVIGQSGSGKSTSLRNLNPESTFIISVLDKPLPFKGYQKRYNAENKNFYRSDDYKVIINYVKAINERRPDITTLVIDDAHFLMANEFMARACERGFDKFSEIAQHMWEVMCAITSTRSNLTCFVLSHNEIDNAGISKPKTVGKLLDDKITLEAMVTVCLHTQVKDGEYKFLTQNDGSHVCKSPIDMFDEEFIDNDLQLVKEKIESYFNDTTEEE
jgi:ABC-type oligopeptide transport system ATPase subunit